MSIVNAHFLNPFHLSSDKMEFDLALSGGVEMRTFTRTPRPVQRDALVQYVRTLVESLSTVENPLELGEVTIDEPEVDE